MRKLPKSVSAGRNGSVNVIELLVVVTILAVMGGIGVIQYHRFYANRQVAVGIKQILMLQDSMNDLSRLCNGYPAPDETMQDILFGFPRIYPRSLGYPPSSDAARCTVPGMAHILPKTNYPRPGCTAGFCTPMGDPFVEGKGSAYCADSGYLKDPLTDAGQRNEANLEIENAGWNIAVTEPQAASNPQFSDPTVTICGNLKYMDSYVTIVVNADGRGVYNLAGGELSNACLSGPWCFHAKNQEEGKDSTDCCDNFFRF